MFFFFFFQAEDGIRDYKVTGVQTCALPICVYQEERSWCQARRRLVTWSLPFRPPQTSIPATAQHLFDNRGRVTLDEAKAALGRGRPVVLVAPPEPEQAGAAWELVGPLTPGRRPGADPPVVVICADDVAAMAWASAPPPHVRVHAVTALGRAARTLTDSGVDVLAGAVQDLAALVSRSTLKLETAHAVVVAWPETFLAGEHAAALDALLGEAKQARRIILSWNPAALRDFLERHAHRVRGALAFGAAGPVSHGGAATLCPVPGPSADAVAAPHLGGPRTGPRRRPAGARGADPH